METTTAPARENKSKANGNDTAPEESKAVVAHETGGQIAKATPRDNQILSVANLDEGVPDMDDMDVAPLDLASEYWAPEAAGETRRLLFSHFAESLVPDKYGPGKNDPDAKVLLENAHFFERKGGEIVSVRQASKVLLSTLRSIGVVSGTMLQIVYKGKMKLSNGNTGDTWGIYPLKPKQ